VYAVNVYENRRSSRPIANWPVGPAAGLLAPPPPPPPPPRPNSAPPPRTPVHICALARLPLPAD
jgi:hypothetical protein